MRTWWPGMARRVRGREGGRVPRRLHRGRAHLPARGVRRGDRRSRRAGHDRGRSRGLRPRPRPTLMHGLRHELQHNTPEQVREYVRETLAIIAELEVPDDLRAVAFTGALNLVSNKNIAIEQTGVGIPSM